MKEKKRKRKTLAEEYSQGFKDGRRVGHSEGYQLGLAEGYKLAMSDVVNYAFGRTEEQK